MKPAPSFTSMQMPICAIFVDNALMQYYTFANSAFLLWETRIFALFLGSRNCRGETRSRSLFSESTISWGLIGR